MNPFRGGFEKKENTIESNIVVEEET